MKTTTIGIDLAKNVLQVHGADANGKPAIRKQLKRREVMAFFANMEPCLIGMEACAPSVTLVVRSFNFFFKPKGAVGVKQKCQPTALNLKTTSFVK